MQLRVAQRARGARVELDDYFGGTRGGGRTELPSEVVLDAELERQLEALIAQRLHVAHAIEREGPDLVTVDVVADAEHRVVVQHQREWVHREPLFAPLTEAWIAEHERVQLRNGQKQLVELLRLVGVVAPQTW